MKLIAFTCFSSALHWFLPWSLIVYGFKSFSKERVCKFLAYSIGPLSSEDNIFSTEHYHHDNALIFAASLLIWYCSFLSLILLLTDIVTFHIYSERLHLKCKYYLIQQ